MARGEGLPLAVRALFAIGRAAVLLRLSPTPEKALARPLSKRLAMTPPRWISLPMPAAVESEEQVIESRGGPLRLSLYRPAGAADLTPAVLYLHGGGFALGGLPVCSWICAQIASRTGFVVAAVEYRLAPDHPFPAALDDCEDALRWLAGGHAAGVDPAHLAVAGDSAGGNLTAALTLRIRETGPAIAHQTLIYPVLDSSLSSESWRRNADAVLDVKAGLLMFRSYAGSASLTDYLVSPLYAPDLADLPPALVITADRDVLRDDGRAYAERLLAAGVPTRYSNYERMPHGFLSIPRLCPPASRALDEIARELSGTFVVA